MTRVRRKANDYINNDDFYKAMCEYKIACIQADEYASLNSTKPEYPKIPEYIGKCVFLIANKLSNAPSFFSYTYKDEMISDAYEDCILRIRSFDHTAEYKNPFAYFTQICYFAFLRRIKKEKREQLIKSEIIKNSSTLDDIAGQCLAGDNDETQFVNTYLKFLQDSVDNSSQNIKTDTFYVKKTTKAHQKKMKALKEREDEMISQFMDNKIDNKIDNEIDSQDRMIDL